MIVPVSRRHEFELLRRLGARRSGPTLALTAVTAADWAAADLNRPDAPHTLAPTVDGALHVAFAIPAALGPAVVRNRARRRLRAALRLLHAEGRIEPGWYLIACRRLSPPLPFDELMGELSRLATSATGSSRDSSPG